MEASQYVNLVMQGPQQQQQQQQQHGSRGQFSALAAEVDRIQQLVNEVCPSGTDWCIVLVDREKGTQLYILTMHTLNTVINTTIYISCQHIHEYVHLLIAIFITKTVLSQKNKETQNLAPHLKVNDLDNLVKQVLIV